MTIERYQNTKHYHYTTGTILSLVPGRYGAGPVRYKVKVSR